MAKRLLLLSLYTLFIRSWSGDRQKSQTTHVHTDKAKWNDEIAKTRVKPGQCNCDVKRMLSFVQELHAIYFMLSINTMHEISFAAKEEALLANIQNIQTRRVAQWAPHNDCRFHSAENVPQQITRWAREKRARKRFACSKHLAEQTQAAIQYQRLSGTQCFPSFVSTDAAACWWMLRMQLHVFI